MTRDRMKLIGISLTDQCGICGDCRETHDHMFFERDYSMQCLIIMKEWLGIQAAIGNFLQLLRWIQRRCNSCKFRKMVMVASLEVAIYQIWQERNNSIWYMQIQTVNRSVQNIKYIVKARVKSRLPWKISSIDCQWFADL